MAKRQKGISNPKMGMTRSKSTYLLEDSVYTFMLNGQTIDESGNQYTVSNEHSNILAVKFKSGYKVVGVRNSMVKGRTYYMLHNPETGLSEIGYVMNTQDITQADDTWNNECDPCTPQAELSQSLEDTVQQPHQEYVKMLGDCTENKCLNFSLESPIASIEIKLENIGEVMAFAHKGNPPRYIELDNLEQYQYIGMEVCGNEAQPTCLDCEKMKIFPGSINPVVKDYRRVLGGSLRKGTYEVAIAYCDQLGNEKTSYAAIVTPPISIFDEGDVIYGQNENRGKTNYSIKITLGRMDSRFSHYKVVVIENTSETSEVGTLLYYVSGVYPTTHTDIIISDNGGEPISENRVMVPLASIEQWEGLTSANGYLIGTGVKEVEEVNLQPVFNLMGGVIKWQSSVVKGDLYKAANANRYKSFNRDEVYPISIKPISSDGYQYPKYPLIGRLPDPNTDELEPTEEGDINVASININVGECDGSIRTSRWQSYNTSTEEGRCDNFNSVNVTFYGFNGEGDLLIDGVPYTIAFNPSDPYQSIEEVVEIFVAQHELDIEANHEVGIVYNMNRITLSPEPSGEVTFENISGNINADVDNRGVPTTLQTENIEVITEVLPLEDKVIVTLLGTGGIGKIDIYGTGGYNVVYEHTLENTARKFSQDEGAQILADTGIIVTAKNNTIVFDGIVEGVTYTNTFGDLGARVSEKGIPPIPGNSFPPIDDVSPISVDPNYIDSYKDLKTYLNGMTLTCQTSSTQWENSPIKELCPYINLDNLEEYNTEPIPESGCQDPSYDIISQYLEVRDVEGEEATYTPKEAKDYSDISPPSNCRVFVEPAPGDGEEDRSTGRHGNNTAIDTAFSGAYFERWDATVDDIADLKLYNRTVLEKQYITYAEIPDAALRIQEVTVENRNTIDTVPFIHPYHGEMLISDVVTPAYIGLLPETDGSGEAEITIEGTTYTITYDIGGTIVSTAEQFVQTNAAAILTNHDLTLTNEGRVLVFHGDIRPTNTPTIVNTVGNLRGEVSVGDNLIRTSGGEYSELLEVTEDNASRILTDKVATETAALDPAKVGDLLQITSPGWNTYTKVVPASIPKFLSKVHKGGIWSQVETEGKERFYVEITKMLNPLATSLRRDYDAGILSSTYFRNRYVRYTCFENETSTQPLEQLREDLTNTKITLTGTTGTAQITINGINYGLELIEDLERTVQNFVRDHGEAIFAVQGQRVRGIGEVITFYGDTQAYDEPIISNLTGNLNGVGVKEDGGYYPMGGIIELDQNHRIEVVTSKLKTSATFNGKFLIVIDLPVTSAVGLGEDKVPGDPGAALYHTVITIPLGSCFSVVSREEEFSKIEVDFDQINLTKIQNWIMRCTFDTPIINSCKPVPHKYGRFSYWESLDTYPDNKELYDSSWIKTNINDIPDGYKSDYARYAEEITEDGEVTLSGAANNTCKPIRHFKFPDNRVSPFMYERKTNRDAEVIIYPLGLRIEDDVFNAFMDIAVENNLIDQERRSKIIGYEVFRGDRSVNKSVLTSGLLFDMRRYKNDIGDDIHYPNYPYNSLGKDKFNLDINGNDIVLDPNQNHIFTFHGPEQDYYKGNTGYSELSVQGYMFGTSRTTIAEVLEHPKFTILGEKAKRLATSLATVEVIAEAVANIANSGEVYRIQFGMANSLNPVGMVFSIANIISSTITLVTTKVGRYRYEWLKTFKDMGSPTNFAYYSTSVARYNYFRTLQSEENLFRGIATNKVLDSGTYSITENITGKPIIVNNLDRETSLMLSFTERFPLDHSASSRYLEYKNYDNNSYSGRGSQVLSYEIGCNEGQSPEVYRNVASPYVALKTYIPNQYGSLGNIRWVSTGKISDLSGEECGLVLGGDTFLVPHTIKRKMPFFKSSAFGQANLTPFAYSVLGNIGKPKFFIDYEINTERSTRENPFPEIESRTEVDCKREDFYLESPSKFYMYSYGQPEFFVETGINTHFRNARPEPWNQFYPQNQDYVGLTQQKTVPIERDNSYFYNYTYSYQGTEFARKMLPDYYSSEVFAKQSYNTNSAMYSLQDVNEDSLSQPWLSYRPNDRHIFPKSNGKLIHLKGIENKQILAVFENTTEIYNAVDTFVRGINSSNDVIGTGGLFASGAVRSFSSTDLGHTGSQSRSMLSNEFGHIIVDSLRGQVFNITPGAKDGGAQEISRYSQGKPNGMDVWFKEHLPFKILRKFPEYREYTDNPYNGVGIALGWDSKFRRVLITKKDYVPVSANIIEDKGIFYNSEKDVVEGIKAQYPEYTYEGIEGHEVKFISETEEEIYVSLPKVELWDENFFKDVSWTITYKPESGYWESYMDFKPNYYVNHTDYFQTGINSSKDIREVGVWSHLLTNRSKQVFYGKRYPWVIEFPTKNEYVPKKLQGLEIWSEAKRYHNEYDYAIDDRVTFNKLNVFSDSQSSGNLELVPNNGTLSMLSKYPITYADRQEVLITRSSGKWTLNDIYNRAKSNRNNLPLFKFDDNQIKKEVNLDAVSFYGKPVLEHLTSENFLVRLTQDKTSQYDMELKFVLQTEEIL